MNPLKPAVVRTVTLTADAGREAARIAFARTLRAAPARPAKPAPVAAPSPCCSAGPLVEGPLVAVARRSQLRQRLGRRALALWSVTQEDGDGRTLAMRVVAVAVSLSAGTLPRTRAERHRFASIIDREGRPLVEADRACSDAAEAVARSFFGVRLVRERAIAVQGRQPGSPDPSAVVDEFQPGLFDRRAERRHQAARAAAATALGRSAARLGALERSAACSSGHARLVLLLLP